MRALAVQYWRRPALWSVAFFSPTVYFLLLLVADRFHVKAAPDVFVASLFCLIPVVALLVCGSVVWRSSTTIARKIGWTVFTLLMMLLQVGILLVIILAAVSAAIQYPQ